MKYFFKALLVLVFFLPGLLFSQAKLNLDESVWGTPVWEDNFDSYSTYSDLEITGRYKLDDTRRDQGNIVEEGQISFDTENDYLIFTAERLPSPVFDQCIDSDSNGVVDQFLYNGLPCDASTPIPDEYRYKTGGLIVEEVINDGINGTPLNGINDFAEHQGCTSTDYGGFYYGMYEIRFKFPTVDNTWPAFWLYTGSDEFDVLELIDLNKFSSGFIDWTGGETSPGFHQNPNYDPNSSAYQIVSDCVSFHQFQRNLSDEWHLLQMVWTPDQISVFFDGIEMKTETRFEVWSCAPDLRFNLYAHAFRPETNFEKAEFLIDYVRVYNKTSWDIADDTTWDSDYMEEYEVRSTSTYQANASPKAIAAGEGNNLFFRDINNQMIYSYFANGDINNIVTHNLGNIASGGPNSSWDVYGDVVVGVNNQVFYPGIDGTLQNYYYKNSEGPGGGWQHGFVDLVIEAEMGVSTKVHLDCGSLDVASIAEGGNRVFYRGQDDLMHYFFWNPSHPNALYNGWVHLNLHMEAGAMDPNARVSGNVVAADGHKVFYRGNDGRIQSFGFDGTNWNHDVIDWNWGNDKFLVSSACGSMDAVKLNGTQHLFYRGQADDQMHHFFYDLSHPAHLGNGWVHEYMPYDHSIQLIDGPVQVDSDGNVYYGSEPLIPLSNLSLVGTNHRYNRCRYQLKIS
ncbi:MAG: family 16 glycosylhydrolase, partial [Bacteroidota bacterium]